jgi:hypothetical protein
VTLGLADAPLLGERLARQLLHRRAVLGPEERTAVPLAEAALFDQVEHLGRELEQAERVGDGRAVLADALGDRVLGVPVLVAEALERACGLDRVQVLALQVLHQRRLERALRGELAHEDRDVLQPGPLRGSPAPLARDDLEAAGGALADQDRLEHSVLADRLRQLLQLGVVEACARLGAVREDLLDRRVERVARHRRRSRCRGLRHRRLEQRVEIRAERLALDVHVTPPRPSGDPGSPARG